MLTEKEIRSLFDKARIDNIELHMRDVAFAILCNNIDSEEFAYSLVFGKNHNAFVKYHNSKTALFAKDNIRYSTGVTDNRSSEEASRKMSFDENKNAMIQLIKDIEEAVENGEMEKKDAFARITDIRVKLNDKFNVSDSTNENLVIVEPKCNFVCPHTRKECHLLSKEEMMKKYNLVEKK